MQIEILLMLITTAIGINSHGQGPMFVQEPDQWVELSNSSGALLVCSAHGSPPPDIRWLDGEGRELNHMSYLREVLHNGSLYFPPFSAENFRPDVHATTYRCLASNPTGSIISRDSILKPDVHSNGALIVDDVTATKGNVAILRCNAAIGGQRSLSWLRDDPLLGRSALHSGGKYAATSASTLHIRDVSRDDTYARFYCQTINKITGEPKISKPARVAVLEPDTNSAPRITYSSSEIRKQIGSQAELECVGEGYPPPKYRWYKQEGGMLMEVTAQSMLVKPMDSVLQFQQVRPEDGGVYVCVVNNVLGEDRQDLLLITSAPLSVYIHPQYQVVDGGSRAVFNCSVHGGEGAVSIVWMKDARPLHEGGRISFQQQNEILVIEGVSKIDRGMYQCYVRSGEETAQGTSQLTLGAIPPTLLTTFVEQTIQPGVSVSLRCIAAGHPPPRLTWLLDGGPLLPRGQYMLGSFLDATGDLISHLNITHARVQHGGIYTCQAKNSLGAVQHSEPLNIYGPPTARPPVNVTAVSGGDVHLQCPVAGYPVVATTWQQGGQPLPVPSNYRQRVFANGTLLISQLKNDADRGEYTCTVRNQQGQSASGKLYLDIKRPPKIAPFHFPANLEEGDRAQISCMVISGDLPIEIMWQKDGRSLSQDPDIQEQANQFVNNLQFVRLSGRHAGHYTCIVKNSAAEVNHTAELVIKVPPSWVIEPEDIAVLVHHPVFFHCKATGFPQPRVSWMKSTGDGGNEYLPLELTSGAIIYGNGTVYIPSPSAAHESVYSCQASNGIGPVLKKDIFLTINVPAHFTSRSLNQSIMIGDEVSVACEAEGDQPLRVTWGPGPVGGGILPPPQTRHTSTGLTSEIRIHAFSRKYAGAYHCTARNDFGHDTMLIYLSVKEPPLAPRSVEVVEVGSRWLSVRWAAASSPVTHFLVQFQEETSPAWNNVTVSGSTHSAHLSALAPSTAYAIRVVAINDVGAGPPSAAIDAVTLQEAPSEPPEDVTAESPAPRTLVIKWKAPSRGKLRSSIVGYKISYREIAAGTPNVRTVRGQQRTEMTLTGLHQYSRYEITVTAFNQVGPGPPSTPFIATTVEGVPEEPPKDVRCTMLSSQALRVRWEPPTNDYQNGIIQGYKVLFKRVSTKAHASDVEMKKTTNLETNIHGLHKYSNYSIRVLAFTSSGEGVQSQPVYCMTEEDVPGPPGLIKALAMTSDSILVSWTRPREPNGIIMKYFIYIQHQNKDIIKEVVYGDKDHMYECRRLKDFQRYKFWVTAATSVGEGEPSVKISQSPISRVPAKIASFSNTVVASVGSRVTLSCHMVGLPAPARMWKGPGGSELPKDSILIDGTLVLGPLSQDMSGNYSCSAENVFGRDEIFYQLAVMVAPAAPILAITAATMNSLTLQWKLASDGGSPVTGYKLSYHKQPNGEWREIHIEADQQIYTLNRLNCGSAYELFIQARNAVGQSKPSPALQAYTKGHMASPPELEELLAVNSTSATVYLESWPGGGCPVLFFSVAWRAQGESRWKSPAGHQLSPLHDVTLGDLTPATRYSLRVAATTEAGTHHKEYVFVTRSKSGEIVPLELIPEQRSSVLEDMNIVLPIMTGIIISITITVISWRMYHKRKAHQKNPIEDCRSKSLMEMENQRNSDQQGHTFSPSSPRKIDSSISANKGSDTSGTEYEIYPYATFNLPSQPMGHSMQFQTFNQRDCYEGRPVKEYHRARMHKPSASTSASPPDGLSLEISCITSQQTLPVARRKGGTKEKKKGSTSFICDSDSSSEKRHIYTQHTPVHPPRNTGTTVYELDSSTESADASPEVCRSSLARKNIHSR
ncbi:Down syndrome cell adhesion molecule-like protein Dscam2 [Nilaparvata lugens]|uniref:Down syndrome cell adhesion molecule-like protein Dscam2 n=1 Tax=Nilaparvata lugens TaxID=108931 RepID=UPI00193D74D2|nr:Down syndrome cell adhesion molecule-like protein Dscam2 [Nilaparvata lugens]